METIGRRIQDVVDVVLVTYSDKEVADALDAIRQDDWLTAENCRIPGTNLVNEVAFKDEIVRRILQQKVES